MKYRMVPNAEKTSPAKPPRMRTIQEAAVELKRIDPETAITSYFIRCMVLDGTIPHVKVGTKRLINLDTLLGYLSCAAAAQPEQRQQTGQGRIRPIKE